MTPRLLFDELWARGDALATVYESLVALGIPQSKADELLRAEWVARVAALDLFVHELFAMRMLEQFEGARLPVPGFAKFRLSAETITRMVNSSSASERSAAFDLEVRTQISHLTFQMPDKIAEALRHTSSIPLWESVAKHQNPGVKGEALKSAQRTIKTTLSSMVERRNKIAHEGDLGPTVPRQPWPIDVGQLVTVRGFILGLVESIQQVMDDDSAPAVAATGAASVLENEPVDDEEGEAVDDVACGDVADQAPPPAGQEFY